MNDSTLREIDTRLFRRALGSFVTGVTVITARDGDGVRGMTANAFMSGSLEPPLCVISIAKRAHMHELLLDAREFGVSILAEGQEELSDHFAGRHMPGLTPAFDTIGGVPVLRDACARVVAEIVTHHDCGDHTIFIGHILHLDALDRPPLVYHSGRYGALDRRRVEHEVAVPEFW
jgi:flavin reductase (DIM6/NTAB) family NADH-FMN oxidoreductase RutF